MNVVFPPIESSPKQPLYNLPEDLMAGLLLGRLDHLTRLLGNFQVFNVVVFKRECFLLHIHYFPLFFMDLLRA